MGWKFLVCLFLMGRPKKIEAMAKAMVESGLADHGWTYINIDDAWKGNEILNGKSIEPNLQINFPI